MGLSEQIEFFAATDVGRKRKHNEDNYLVDQDLSLFIVCDGMGGHAAGEVASAMAVRTVHEVISANRDMLVPNDQGPRSETSVRQVLGLLEYAVQSASARIHAEAQSDPRKRGMGTTLSLLIVIDSHAYVAHVGDSRIYLLRGGVVQRVTEDHTVANELLRMGMVEPDQVHKVPRSNAITRAVGVYQHVEVDTLTLEVLPSDQFLLASDGLSGYLDETSADLCHMLAGLEGQQAVQSLVDFANDSGGRDNVTTLLVRLGGGDGSDNLRARRVTLKREVMGVMPLFSRLNERELMRLMQVAYVRQYDTGDKVVEQGDPGHEMFVILDGQVDVTMGEATLRELGPGEHFGEMALIRSTARSATVTAKKPSELIALGRDDFFHIIRSEPVVAVKLLWQFLGVLANRLERTSADLSQAREELGGVVSAADWISDEPSLDPFAHSSAPPPLSLQLSARLPIDMGTDDEEPPRPTNTPSFADAPAMAERRSAPPPVAGNAASEGAAPKGEHEPDTERRVRAAVAAFGGPDAAIDPKATKPEQPATKKAQTTAAGADEVPDAKDTLPSESGRRRKNKKLTDTMRSTPTPKELLRPRKETVKLDAVVADDAVEAVRGDEPATASSESVDSGEVATPRRGRLQTQLINEPADVAVVDVPNLDEAAAGAEDTPEEDFRPTKVTIPLQPPESLRSELDALRKEFKARLVKSRKERKRKDSD